MERILKISVWLASGLALATLLIEYGFRTPPIKASLLHAADYIIIIIFVANAFLQLFMTSQRLQYLKAHIVEFVLATLLLITLLLIRELIPFIHPRSVLAATKIYLIVIQVYIIGYMVFHLSFVGGRVSELGLKPPQIVLLSFLSVVMIGTLLLSLPNATASGERAPLLTALFTATSAVTVTGLIVVDTGSYFSPFGQIVILALIQVGGLGMMTLVSFFAVMIGREIGLRESAVVGDILDHAFMGRVWSLVITIILTTAALELAGTVLLYTIWKDDPFFQGRAFYYSLFHAVSAFCNAGFSLFHDSFMRFRSNYAFNFIMITLIVLGGLGFQVLRNIMSTILSRLTKGGRREHLSLHTKLVLTTSAVLLASGAAIFFLLPEETAPAKLPAVERAMAALFQSVTTRTAGFNTVDIGSVGNSFLLIALVLMFIGASPGSTGGGIKTSTAAVIFASIKCTLAGRERVDTFRRTIPDEFIKKTIAVLVGSFGLIVTVTFLLTLFEKKTFMDLLFEATSAVGTVGLSRGITSHLTPAGQILIVIAMFLGRIGPLTLFLALTYTRKKGAFEYPEEKVLIG